MLLMFHYLISFRKFTMKVCISSEINANQILLENLYISENRRIKGVLCLEDIQEIKSHGKLFSGKIEKKHDCGEIYNLEI